MEWMGRWDTKNDTRIIPDGRKVRLACWRCCHASIRLESNGNVKRQPYCCGWVDYGGQWVGPTQDRFYALIKEMGGEIYPSPNFGKALQRSVINPN